MFPGSVEITQRLFEIGESHVEQYLAALRFHFALWKWQRISDQQSLSFLRRMLVTSGLAEPSPDPGWIVNRGLAQYRTGLGDFESSLDGIQRKWLNGHVSFSEPPRAFDSGSGNGTACYEMSRPGILHAGSGLSLVFSVDGTIRNWLREPLRSARIATYRSALANYVIKRVEMWSVFRLISAGSDQDDFDPIELLEQGHDDGIASARSLISVLSQTDDALNAYRNTDDSGGALVAAVALGYLIDALAGRVRSPNGMQFSYQDAEPCARGMRTLLDAVKACPIHTESGKRLLSSAPRVEEFATRIVRHLSDKSLQPEVDIDVADALPELANQFKAVAFELRERGGDVGLVQALHVVGNELWRWHFFLKDVAEWKEIATASRKANSCCRSVRSWLDRPWGILRPDDMKYAMAEGFDSSEDMPMLVSALLPLLRNDVNSFLKESFRDAPHAANRIEGFIAHRCRIRDLREMIVSVSYEDKALDITERRELGDLLVELLTLWFYSLPSELRCKLVAEELRPLVQVLEEGSWCAGGLPSGASVLSRRQRKLFEEYRANPKEVTGDLFEFSPESCILDRADLYPLEEFWIIPSETTF